MICPEATPLARFKKAMTLAPNPHAVTRDDAKQRRRLATGPFRHPNPSQKADQSILDPDQLFLLDLRGLRARLGSQLEGIGENLHAELEKPRIVDVGLIARSGPGTLVRAGNPRHAVDHSVEVLVQQLESTIDDPRQLLVGSFGGSPGDELSLERRQSILIALAVKPPRDRGRQRGAGHTGTVPRRYPAWESRPSAARAPDREACGRQDRPPADRTGGHSIPERLPPARSSFPSGAASWAGKASSRPGEACPWRSWRPVPRRCRFQPCWPHRPWAARSRSHRRSSQELPAARPGPWPDRPASRLPTGNGPPGSWPSA